MTDTRPQVAIRFSDEQAGILRDAAHGTSTLTAALRRVLANGLRWGMTHGTHRPMSEWLMRDLDDEEVFELYLKYGEAICAEIGLGGGYRFEQVAVRMNTEPPAVFWPLAQDEELAHDGQMVVRRPLPADADMFWAEKHRSFDAEGNEILLEKPEHERRRLYEEWKRERDTADGGTAPDVPATDKASETDETNDGRQES